MNTYQNTKPTNITWLGEVPSHWEVSKLGRILKPFSEKNHAHLPLLSITRELGVIERDIENQDENHNFIPDDLSGYKLLKKGQFGMNKMKAWQGSYGVSPFTGIVSPAYFIFDFLKEINPNFFHWAIRCKLYVSFFGSASDGVRVGQWDLSKSRMKEIPFVIPPLSEQTAIANFLDKKTAQIKEAIALKSEQIDKLKEYRQTLINQTVTQGLNPTVPMKNSGVEWLGEIPSHWEVRRFRHLFSFRKGLAITKENLQDTGIPCVNYGEIHSKFGFSVNPEFDELKCVSEDYLKHNQKSLINYGDFVFADTSEDIEGSGNFTYLNSNKVTFAGYHTIICSSKKNCHSRFLAYIFDSLAFRNQIRQKVKGVKVFSITQNVLKDNSVWLPPKNEQIAIADFLDKKTAQIDTAIRQYQAEIDKLKEYQQSLVNDVVTGKVRVSNLKNDIGA